jgi:hypothetical protein
MKTTNTVILLVILICSGGVFAQAPTIHSSEFHVVGDSLVFQPCNADNFNPGSSGANVTWDFSHVIATGGHGVQYWVAPSANFNGDSFPAANQSILSPSGIPGVFTVDDYLQLTSSSLSIRGYEVPDITYYDDAEDFVRFPCTYTNAFTDSFHATISPDGSPQYYRSGAISVQADGWGTLKLPTGNFTNVLRVKFVENYKDDLTSMGAGYVYYTSLLYNWYKPGVKGALLAYDSAWHTNSSGTKMLSYQPGLSGTTGIEQGASLSSLRIYPNPADHVVTISSPEARYEYSFADLSGQVVASALINEGDTRIDISGFAKGMYLVSVKLSTGNTITQKLIVN